MAAPAAVPLKVAEACRLTDAGIAPASITFGNLTMSSDKAVCVRETGAAKTTAIVDLGTGSLKKRFPMPAEAAILTPDAKHIAVRSKDTVQIFNLEIEKKVKQSKMAEPIEFWRWINGNTIGIVTSKSVFHWSIDGDVPQKMFDRHAVLEGTKLLNYAASVDGKWLMAVGIKRGEGGSLAGCMQLYSMEKKVTQPLKSHAGCFTTARVDDGKRTAILFCFVEQQPGQKPKLRVIEVGKPPESPGAVVRLVSDPMPVPAGAEADFAVAVEVSPKHDMVYVVTKMGYVYLYDILTATVLFRTRVSDAEPVFATCQHEATNGVIAVTSGTGRVILTTINEAAIVNYVKTTLRNPALAMKLAGRLNITEGAEDLFKGELDRLLGAGDVDGAARLVASSGDSLRTADTIRRFTSMPTPPGGQSPAIRYFTILMEKVRLNAVESVEISRPAIAAGRFALIDRWLKEDKITCSKQLGDMVAPLDQKKALQIYHRAGDAHDQVIQMLLATGEFAKVVPYATKVGAVVDYKHHLQNMVHTNPKAAQEMASQLCKQPGGPLIEIPTVVDIFMQFSRLQECTSFLLDVLADDKPDQGFLQTKLLEMNLLGGAPQVVEAILSSDMLHHFDKPRIAHLCEKAGGPLLQRAMELYDDLDAIKRIMVNTHIINKEFLINFFGSMDREACLECLDELLVKNKANMQIVVAAATKYYAELTPESLITLFERHKSYEGLYYFLGGIVADSTSPEVHYQYIVAAAHMKRYPEVERVCRKSKVYDPVRVKEFLIDAKLPDPRPLIHVCDIHGYVDELTAYLFNNDLLKFIEVYVQKVAPAKTPQVVGKLLDLDAEETFIKTNILDSVRHACPVDPLVEEVERRNRLRLLQPWLEARISEGNVEPATHNAIGKIYITLNKDPHAFLKNNQFYDSLVIGRFCEKLDPYLAYLAYKRAGKACDAELIEVTNNHSLFKDQARYLVERQDQELWATVLDDANPHRRDLIDQVTGTALPETKNPDEVSATVKAFMTADLPNELIGLLEKLVLQGTDFAENRNLQNLLILTAIKCSEHDPDGKPKRAMEYIQRLDNFDGPQIAGIAMRDEYRLYEEAYTIYDKFKLHLDAIKVILGSMEELERGLEYAERVDDAAVWSELAQAQLNNDLTSEAIVSYCKASDASNFEAVIATAEAQDKFDDLIKYLEMAREKMKERRIDTALIYAFAQCKRLGDLEMFITSPNVAEIQSIGDRCFDEGLYEAARLLYNSINNNAKLASTLVHLELYREAVDAARKANSTRTWKEVNAACVTAGEFRLAQIAGLQIIISPDHLEELIVHYERAGHFEELIKLMEQGLGQDSAHQGIFTELGVLYSKYRPEKLMDHVKIYWNRVSQSRLLRACERGLHWQEAVYLHMETKEFDLAVRTMMDHSAVAFDGDRFLDIIKHVRNQELFYSAISFYLKEEPMQLEKLLKVLTPKLDHTRVVHQLRKVGDSLLLVLPYLKFVQKENIAAVNEAVNEILVEEEDYEGLKHSVDEFGNFDQIAMAQSIEKHELLEFRRIAALLYKRNRRWSQSIELSKADNMFKDAIDTAAESEDRGLAEGLLKWFVEEREDKESFCATLYTCYNLIRPDVALELAWRFRLMDYVMPYMIQVVRRFDDKISELDERTKPKGESKAEEEAAKAAAEAVAYGYAPGVLQIAATPYNDGSMMGGVPGMAPPGAYPGAPPMGHPGMPDPSMGYPGTGYGMR